MVRAVLMQASGLLGSDHLQANAVWSDRWRVIWDGLEHPSSVDLVILPELHHGPYFCQDADPAWMDHAEPIPGPTTDWASAMAAEHKVVVVASVFERRAPGLCHNTAVVLDKDGSLAGLYRKMHIPDDPGYCEKFYFAPGDLGFYPIETTLGKLGVLVCWDQWFPEAARLMALRGAQCLIYPTAIGWDPRESEVTQKRQLAAWQTVQTAHAVTNGIPVLVCNRTGWEPHPIIPGQGITFWGHSFAAGVEGQLLAQALDLPEALEVTWDPNATSQVRSIWPFLRDRRVDAYQDLSQRWAE